MQGERKFLDVIVRGIDEMSLSLSSALIHESRLRFFGALLDPSTESRAAVNLQVSITRDLVPEHIPPTAVWQLGG